MPRRKKILVVDDEREIAELVAMNLQRNGYDTLVAHDGPTGLDIARKQKPDMIVLDVMMPGLSGRDVTVAPQGTATTPPPAISGVRISPNALRRKRGATVTFTLSHAATVALTIKRKLPGRKVGRRCVNQTRSNRAKKRCSRLVAVGTFTRAGVAGPNSFHFTGRANGRALARGNYTLSAVATDAAGKTSAAASRPFRIIK